MEKVVYQITKKQCQEQIDKRSNVCERCGRKIVPLKTVDNSGNPTYWSGCMHGQTKKGAWGNFTGGVEKYIYDLATKLVLEDDINFGMSYKKKALGDFEYAFQSAVSVACEMVRCIEWMKNNNPRYTRKQLEKQFKEFIKHIKQ